MTVGWLVIAWLDLSLLRSIKTLISSWIKTLINESSILYISWPELLLLSLEFYWSHPVVLDLIISRLIFLTRIILWLFSMSQCNDTEAGILHFSTFITLYSISHWIDLMLTSSELLYQLLLGCEKSVLRCFFKALTHILKIKMCTRFRIWISAFITSTWRLNSKIEIIHWF